MPLKPIKYGFKAYVLCERDTGYVVNWSLHLADNESFDRDNSKTHHIVLNLVEGLEWEGYSIYMDRYYTTLQLFIDLRAKGIGACGTIQMNRLHITKEYVDIISKLDDREITYFEYFKDKSCLALAVWKDTKTVLVISNFHKQGDIEIERRLRKKDRAGENQNEKKL